MLRLLLLSLACLAAGCGPPTPPASSAGAMLAYDREDANAAGARRLLDAGRIDAGQSVDAVIQLARPHHIDFVGPYAFIEYYEVPALGGLSLTAVDGRTVSARNWTCTGEQVYFDTLTPAQRAAANEAYGTRLDQRRH
jgi:hypothetical protein